MKRKYNPVKIIPSVEIITREHTQKIPTRYKDTFPNRNGLKEKCDSEVRETAHLDPAEKK